MIDIAGITYILFNWLTLMFCFFACDALLSSMTPPFLSYTSVTARPTHPLILQENQRPTPS